LSTKTFSDKFAGAKIRPILDNAKESLWIVSPWLGKDYARDLVSISQRGIEVRIITSKNDFNNESIGILKASENPKLHILVFDEKTTFIHSKIYIADEKFGISGSANLTYSGLNTNHESLNLTETEEEILRLKADFMKIWLKYEGEGLSKEELSSNPSCLIRNALPLPSDYSEFINQPHIEKKGLVYNPYFFFEFNFRGSVMSTPLVFEDHGLLVIDGLNRQIINNDYSLIEEISNKTPKDYLLKTDNKYNLKIREPSNLNLREAHELALEYVIKKNTKKYKKYKDNKGEIRFSVVPENKGIAFIKENTQFYGQKAESRVYVPERNNISFIKEYFVQVPIWHLVMNEPDGLKHQKVLLASSGKIWTDLIFCPVCQNKIFMKDSVSCTVCGNILCQKCIQETGLILKKKYCPSCYQSIPTR
jgi:hypothetical protein